MVLSMDYMLEPPVDHKAVGIEEMVGDWSDEKVVKQAILFDLWNPNDEYADGTKVAQPPVEELRESLIDILYWADE